MLRDPHTVVVDPERAICTRCTGAFVLSGKIKYDIQKWDRHRARCEQLNSMLMWRRAELSKRKQEVGAGGVLRPRFRYVERALTCVLYLQRLCCRTAWWHRTRRHLWLVAAYPVRHGQATGPFKLEKIHQTTKCSGTPRLW